MEHAEKFLPDHTPYDETEVETTHKGLRNRLAAWEEIIRLIEKRNEELDTFEEENVAKRPSFDTFKDRLQWVKTMQEDVLSRCKRYVENTLAQIHVISKKYSENVRERGMIKLWLTGSWDEVVNVATHG